MKEFSAHFVGAKRVRAEGEGKAQQVFHYHRGEPERWRENVPSYEAVAYRGVYDGIDLRVTGGRTGIKYEFIVAPEADWRQVRVRYDGIERLTLREDGALVMHLGSSGTGVSPVRLEADQFPKPETNGRDARATNWPALVDAAPVIYQEVNGRRKEVAGKFALLDEQTYAFAITGEYDPAQPLVIDPQLEWSTYLGGSSQDYGLGIAVDSAGNVLVTGDTGFSFGGWASGGFDTSLNGGADAFVAKLSPAGAHLWSTYLGGSSQDYGYGIAVDSAGNVLVTGLTFSSGWASGGFDTSHNGGTYDAFVAKLSPSGAHLWSTYLGGNDLDQGRGIAADSAGNVLVTGETLSGGWVSGGFDTS